MSRELVTVKAKALEHLAPGGLRVVDDELQRGNLRAVRAMVKLQPGDATDIQGKALLSPDGADRLNRIAGIQIIELANPQYRQDQQDDNGFQVCTRSAVALGRDAFGNRVMAGPMTVSFRPRAYLMHALVKIAKGRRNQEQGPKPVVWDVDGNKPQRDGAWKRFVVDGDLALWADLTHPDVASALETFAQDRKFADRRCMGTLRRNLLCAHPGGFPKHPGNEVPVIAWQPTGEQEERELEDLGRAIAEAEDPRAVLPAGTRIIDTAPVQDAEEMVPVEDERDAADDNDNPGGF